MESKQLQAARELMNSRYKAIAQMVDAHQLPLMEGKKIVDWINSLIKAAELVAREKQKEKDAEIAQDHIPCCSQRPTAGDEIAEKIKSQP